MKKSMLTYCVALVAALLILTSVTGVLAGTTPASRAEFAAAYPGYGEQLFGTSHLGDLAAHNAPLTLAGYAYQLSAVNGLYIDPADVTTEAAIDELVITFSGPDYPTAICLGIILMDMAGDYLPGQPINVSVNGGAGMPYSTASDFAGNEMVIFDLVGISTIRIMKDVPDAWVGIRSLLVAPPVSQTEPGESAAVSETTAESTDPQETSAVTGIATEASVQAEPASETLMASPQPQPSAAIPATGERQTATLLVLLVLLLAAAIALQRKISSELGN